MDMNVTAQSRQRKRQASNWKPIHTGWMYRTYEMKVPLWGTERNYKLCLLTEWNKLISNSWTPLSRRGAELTPLCSSAACREGAVIFIYPYPCPKNFYELPAVLVCYTNSLCKLSWAWAWVWMSQPRDGLWRAAVSFRGDLRGSPSLLTVCRAKADTKGVVFSQTPIGCGDEGFQ